MAGAGDPSPIGAEEARSLFRELAGAGGLLLAVSGGPDSMALLALASAWALEKGAGERRPPVFVATVDHGLRPEARAEADMVVREASRLGVSAAALAWAGPKPGTRLQEAAREARYALLAAQAGRLGATHVVTAHHAGDQAETVLMRLVRGSGLDGLAGMARERALGGVRLVRPFLSIPKARLIATAAAAGLPCISDPSNADPRFGRTRARRLAALLEAEGLTSARLATLAARSARAEAALDVAAGEASVRLSRAGAGMLHLDPALFELPDEIVLRVLMSAVRQVAGDHSAPLRLERAERLATALAAAARGGLSLRRTLGGCVVTLDGLGHVTIAREGSRSRGLALFTGRKRRRDMV